VQSNPGVAETREEMRARRRAWEVADGMIIGDVEKEEDCVVAYADGLDSEVGRPGINGTM